MRPSWSDYFMLHAKLAATRSTCNSRPVGCVFVKDHQILSTGYNGPVPGAPHCSDKGPDYCVRRNTGVKDAKKSTACIASHAEINGIAQAATHGICIRGTSIFTTLQPCFTCMKALRVAGIERIYFETYYDPPFWTDLRQVAFQWGFKYILQWPIAQEVLDKVLPLLLNPTSTRRMEATD